MRLPGIYSGLFGWSLRSRWQWQPGTQGHDPYPPLLIEDVSTGAGNFASAREWVSGNDATAWPPTTLADLNAGEMGVIVLAFDNTNTTDGDFTEVISCTDSAGNNYAKAGEYTNGNGGINTGATVSIWYTIATNTLSSGGTITPTFAGSPGRKAITGHAFTFGGVVTTSGSTGRADDAADAGSITGTPSTGSRQHLWIRGTACESTNTSYAASSNYTAFNHSDSTTFGIAGSDKNMGARGEYRIYTDSSDSTDPTTSTADHASVMVFFDDTGSPAPSFTPGLWFMAFDS